MPNAIDPSATFADCDWSLQSSHLCLQLLNFRATFRSESKAACGKAPTMRVTCKKVTTMGTRFGYLDCFDAAHAPIRRPMSLATSAELR